MRPVPPLVLVHDWGGSATSWSTLHWPEGSHAVAVDLADACFADGMRAAAETVLAQLDGPAVIVGHGMGGQITALIHAEHPELVAAECVIEPAYGHPDADRERMLRWRDELAADPRAAIASAAFSPHTSAELRDAVMAGFEATPARVLVDSLDAQYFAAGAVGFDSATRPLLARRSRPTLGVFSTESAAEGETGADTVVWPGFGHYLHLEAPTAFVRTLHRWLDRV